MYIQKLKSFYSLTRPKFLLFFLFFQILTYIFILSDIGVIAYYELVQNINILKEELLVLDAKRVQIKKVIKAEKESKEKVKNFIRKFLLYQEEVHVLKFINHSTQKSLAKKPKLSILPPLQTYYIIINFLLLLILVFIYLYTDVHNKTRRKN